MIDKITIIFFQSHKKTVLRLCQGINGIIGRSNSGKSAIIRAVELLRKNRPLGFAYHSTFANRHHTKVYVKNQKEDIRFVKSKSKSEYLLYRKETFTGFKGKVPDEITDALNLDDINFSSQLGLPYLITSSPAEIARVINQVTKAEDIEKCISIAKGHVTAYKSKHKDLLAEINNVKSRLTRFVPMKNLAKEIKKAEVLEKKIKKQSSDIAEIRKIVNFIKTAKNSVIAEDLLLKPAELIDKAESLQSEIDAAHASMALVEQVVSMRESIKTAKVEKKGLIKRYTNELKWQKKCPTCMSKITNKQLQYIRDELK